MRHAAFLLVFALIPLPACPGETESGDTGRSPARHALLAAIAIGDIEIREDLIALRARGTAVDDLIDETLALWL
ncbi:MAG: hypothetical protein MUE73_01325 [Planctomycetes bacterium]|jgi:hypothetical protein|nr:hypothetical protein [Planctomycetota bacterium]